MQIDTAYAGAPVISGPALASAVGGTVQERFDAPLGPSTSKPLAEFAERNQCTSYTAGCKKKVETAGGVQEERAFLWQCDAIELATKAGYRGMRRLAAEVVMGSAEAAPHILTIDYLRDVSPCVFWKMQTLEMPRGVRNAWLSTQFQMQPLKLHAGAPVVTVYVQDTPYQLLVDTGAPFACMLFKPPPAGASARKGIQDARGKGVPAASLTKTVRIGRRSFSVPVLYSSAGGPDGLLGLRILEQLDVYLGTDTIGFA